MSRPIAKRQHVMEAALQLFVEKGIEGTTTREIAQGLDISEALMFKYFPSKEALYQAIIRKKTDGSEEMLFPKEAMQAKDDQQVFQAIASYFIRKNTEDPTFMRLILYSSLEGHDLSNIFFENHATERTRLLSKYIRQRIKEKAFKKVPPMLAARAFMGMVIHYVQTEEIHGMKATSRFSQKKVVSTLVDAFLNGLKGNQSPDEARERKPAE